MEATTTSAAPAAPTTTGGTMAAASQAASAPAASAPTTETVNPGSWMTGFSDELKGYTTTKGFKDPAAVLDSYRNLEKLIGAPQERVMKLPEKFYDDVGALTPEGRQIYERLGAPKDAKEYGLEKFVPKEGGDPKLMEHFANIFKEAGIPKSAAEKIAASWNDLQAQTLAQQTDAARQKFKDETNALAKDWGAALDQNTNIAMEGKRRLGHDDKTVDALAAVLGHAQTMKLYHQLGSAVGESTFIGGKQTQTSKILDPNSAKAEIAALKADPGFRAKFVQGDAESVAKLQKLNQQAYPGTVNF